MEDEQEEVRRSPEKQIGLRTSMRGDELKTGLCACACVRAVQGVCVQPSVSNVSERGAFLMKHFSRSDNYTSRKQGHLQSMCET